MSHATKVSANPMRVMAAAIVGVVLSTGPIESQTSTQSSLDGQSAVQTLPPWTTTLPVQPGESLKNRVDDGRDKQVVTFFQLDEPRTVNGSVFISGSGYVEIKGGGTYYAGMNRAQDPFLELTITTPESPVFQQCRNLLDQKSLDHNAIAIGGEGYFTSMPGIRDRGLGIVRLDSVTRCELVPRR